MTQPPIVPGPYDPSQGWEPTEPGPYTLANVLPVSKPKQRRWGLAIAVFVVIVAVGSAGVLLYPRLRTVSAPAAPTTPPQTALRAAYVTCGQRGEISDGDRTLFLDMAGNDPGSGDLTLADLSCYVGQLKMPHYVLDEMSHTTALNGRQSDTWGDFSASWTYHPDNGLDVLIRQVKG